MTASVDPGPCLDLPFDPMSETALMMAYRHLDYAHAGITFEEACRSRGLLLAMKNCAEALERQSAGRPHRKGPRT